MKINFLAGMIGVALVLSPLGFAQQRQDDGPPARQNSGEVQRAIAFQRAKDRADERQSRLEARHPNVDDSSADHHMDNTKEGHRVPDPGPKPKKR